MSSSTEPHRFDDPALKAAVRRVWGAERAPAEVSRRISGMMHEMRPAAAAPAVDASPSMVCPTPVTADPTFWQRSPFYGAYGLAAAASVLLALGGILCFLNRPAPDANQVAKTSGDTQSQISQQKKAIG